MCVISVDMNQYTPRSRDPRPMYTLGPHALFSNAAALRPQSERQALWACQTCSEPPFFSEPGLSVSSHMAVGKLTEGRGEAVAEPSMAERSFLNHQIQPPGGSAGENEPPTTPCYMGLSISLRDIRRREADKCI